MVYFLLSWHGYFIGCRPNVPVCLRTADTLSVDQILRLDIPPSVCSNEFSDFLGNMSPSTQEVILPGVGSFRLCQLELSNVVALQQGDRYLCALPDGSLVCDRDKILAWEQFVLVSEHDLSQLQHIMADSWIVASNRAFVPKGGICIETGPSLRIGPLKLPLGPNLPFANDFSPFRFPVHPDGWKFDRIILYRPLIFYVAFGENAIGQFCVSVKSLFQIGNFDGRVLVFTDMPEQKLRKKLNEIPPAQLLVTPLRANDWVGFVAAKFAILEEDVAYECSPVVFMDPDIVYNTDVRPMLVDMACLDSPSAPLEHFSNLATSPSVGGQLIQRDNGNPMLSCGFNVGTLAVPNLKEFGHVLALIRRTIQNYVTIHGRAGIHFIDQEVANYISFKFAHFDTGQLTRYVRFGFMQDAFNLGALSGLVHFWGIPRTSRIEPMQRYLDLLIDHYHGRKLP